MQSVCGAGGTDRLFPLTAAHGRVYENLRKDMLLSLDLGFPHIFLPLPGHPQVYRCPPWAAHCLAGSLGLAPGSPAAGATCLPCTDEEPRLCSSTLPPQ